jgi:hypothetical protein
MAEKQSENRVDTPSVPTVAELQAEISRLKAEREDIASVNIRELLEQRLGFMHDAQNQRARAEAAEARLSAISEMAERWREEARDRRRTSYLLAPEERVNDVATAYALDQCADDLSALVPGASAGGGVPEGRETASDYTVDEALQVAEGPSTLRDLVASFHSRGLELHEAVHALGCVVAVLDAHGIPTELAPGQPYSVHGRVSAALEAKR